VLFNTTDFYHLGVKNALHLFGALLTLEVICFTRHQMRGGQYSSSGGCVVNHRIVCALIIVCVVFTGCGVLKREKSFEKVGNRLLKLTAYTCDVTMRVTNNKSTMEYKLKHFYKSPDKYRLEVLAPEELKGQVTIYNGSSSYIYHPKINRYLVTENFSNSVEYNSFIGSFMNHIKKTDNIRVSKEKDGEKELLVLEFEVPEGNDYMHLEKLWIDAEKAQPVKAEIYGDDGKITVLLYYNNFVYNPDLDDNNFAITQEKQ